MDTNVLIDSITRQTTVLIAQLSSAAGVRAPLAHIADEVFLSLSRELEDQGVSRKVVADMFGLALRGYQRRVRRLGESQTDRGATLWQVAVQFIEKNGPVERRRINERFRHDDAAAVGAVLSDLVANGLLKKSGSGEDAVFEMTPEGERTELAKRDEIETTSALVWLTLCRDATLGKDEIAAQLRFSPERVDEALARLFADGTIQQSGEKVLVEPLTVPVGAESGWEVAVFDHFQTMCVAIATKLQAQGPRAREGDTTGGQTLSFEIDDAHPEKEAVLELLERTRKEANALWQRVEDHNRKNPLDDRRRVAFYVGQVEMPSEESE